MKKLLNWLLEGLIRKVWGGKADWTRVKRLLALIFQFRALITVSVVCMVIFNLFNAMPAWYIKDVVDALQEGNVPEINRFVLVGIIIFAIYACKGIFYFGYNYLLGKASQRMIHQLRSQLYRHLQSLPVAFFSSHHSGDLIARFTADLITLQHSVRVVILGPLRDIPQIFLLMAILIYRSWVLFLLSIVIIPIALLLIHSFGKRTKRLSTQRMASFGELTTVLQETISGIRVVKAFNMEQYEQDRFEKSNSEVLHKYNQTLRIMAYSPPVLESIGALAGAGIIVFGGYLIIQGTITPGDFVSFLLAFFMLNEPIKKLNAFHLQVQEGLAAADRVYELLEVESQKEDPPQAGELAPIADNLYIQIRSFSYENAEEPVLSDIDLKVGVGQVVALVGPSGAGKTTLVNLIPRFFELSEGSIRIDGVDIRDCKLASLRNQIAIVTQEIFLFNDTIGNNIAYGNIECPIEEIEAAAKAANAHDFIMEFPNGYQTQVGEGGIHLSGGQRQRLSIARALIKDAPILILDEATSALDSEAEQEVQSAITTLIRNRTTIVIAHRLSTISHADLICVMAEGSIVERGGHDELMLRNGLYKKLYDLQFRDLPSTDSGLFQWRRIWNRMTAGESRGAVKSN